MAPSDPMTTIRPTHRWRTPDHDLTADLRAVAEARGIGPRALAVLVARGHVSEHDLAAYFDAPAAKNHTPATPAISLMQALDVQLDAIALEGWQARFARHRRLMEQVHAWVRASGFELFAEDAYRSPTVTAVRNTLGVDVRALNAYLRERGMLISDGYGPLKGQTFRIAHMGDVTEEGVAELLQTMSEFLQNR